MRIESKLKRKFWFNTVLGTIPDVLIAFGLTVWFNSGLVGFVAVFIGLQILYLLIWTKNSIWGWIMFHFGARRQMAKYLCDFLRESKFPDPGDYQVSVDSYFHEIVNNDHLPFEVRIKAAGEIAALNAYGAQGQAQYLMRLQMAWEDAIEEYKRTFTPTRG